MAGWRTRAVPGAWIHWLYERAGSSCRRDGAEKNPPFSLATVFFRQENLGNGSLQEMWCVDPSVSLTADSSPCAGEPGMRIATASVRTGFAMTDTRGSRQNRRAAARVDPTEENKKCGRYRVSGVVERIFFIGYILLPYSFYFIFLNFII